MQIPILNGIYTDESGDYRTSYPRNMIPVPKDQGISQGYLRPADGINEFVTTTGIDRGGWKWEGEHYRVIGTELVLIDEDGTQHAKGTISGNDLVVFDESFDYLSISADGKLWFFDGTTLTRSNDVDLGLVLDHVWIDSYTMTTDGEFLVVNDLDNHLSINPLKYGSSEANPDPIKALLRHRNEAYALNRHTIEVFKNVGGSAISFPFTRIESAQIQRGCIGTHACCVFDDAIAFLGSKKKEPCALWLGINGGTAKISTREIDQVIQEYTEEELAQVKLETRIDKSHALLYMHLPDQTLVYDLNASKELGQHVWFTLTSSKVGKSQYQARNLVWCHNRWYVGDPTSNRIGILTNSTSEHYGKTVGWDFSSKILYNEARGAIFHELELIALTGRVPLGVDPTVWTSFSNDGEVFSKEIPQKAGKQGERNARLSWFSNGMMEQSRIQKFRGTSDAHISPARLEARIEALNV